jgi:hypothetical protein
LTDRLRYCWQVLDEDEVLEDDQALRSFMI